jgi:hypothetical protein
MTVRKKELLKGRKKVPLAEKKKGMHLEREVGTCAAIA